MLGINTKQCQSLEVHIYLDIQTTFSVHVIFFIKECFKSKVEGNLLKKLLKKQKTGVKHFQKDQETHLFFSAYDWLSCD